MKKFGRIFLITLSSLLLLYGVFVGIDCVRLYSADESQPPMVIMQATQKEDYSIKYTGLGYTVTYRLYEKIALDEYESNQPIYGICGAEFRLFDKILLWAWIE